MGYEGKQGMLHEPNARKIDSVIPHNNNSHRLSAFNLYYLVFINNEEEYQLS